MNSLLLRLAAPLQSWGAEATHHWRPTRPIPTRSGIEGLLTAALGHPNECIAHASMFVRVERRGSVGQDFHTVSPPSPDVARSRVRRQQVHGMRGGDWVVPIASGSAWRVSGECPTLVTRRLFLQDAEFFVAIADDDGVLSRAVERPVFSPYLGRRAFAPTFPFHLGEHDGTPYETLRTLPNPPHPVQVYELRPDGEQHYVGDIA